MVQRILVIDPDTAFATLLKEGLEQTGRYAVHTLHEGADPLGTLASDHFDMVILDMGLVDPPAAQAVQTLRTQQPHLPLMIIPLGDTLPPEIGALGIHGVLTKPFFLPDLPELVARAMEAKPVAGAPESIPAPPIEETAFPPAHTEPVHATSWIGREKDLSTPMTALARELNAEAVILTCGHDLIAHAGRFARKEAEQLARVIVESWQASARVAQLLGREKVRFEQSMHEGSDYMLYSLSVTEDTILSVALRASTPLGMIRYHTKQIAESIARLANG